VHSVFLRTFQACSLGEGIGSPGNWLQRGVHSVRLSNTLAWFSFLYVWHWCASWCAPSHRVPAHDVLSSEGCCGMFDLELQSDNIVRVAEISQFMFLRSPFIDYMMMLCTCFMMRPCWVSIRVTKSCHDLMHL
jgi:hypothetical protein